MIQTLPLLPPDWGTWKWDEGNLSATTEQTQQSYQTLIEKGLCANFSRLVWNDIVDLTANALQAAGIEWDSRYGSIESCKISEQMGSFMANMFNGVVANINRMGLFKWKWELNYKDPSYLGRPYVNGASTHGERADNIYAMYILELVKRLNWFLSVLKDEANFNEQIGTSESQLKIHPKFASLITAPSRSYENILSLNLTSGRVLQVAPHKSLVYGSNLNDAELLARVVAAANTELLSSSSVDAVSRMIYTLSIRVVSLFMGSKPYATLDNIPAVGLVHEQKSTTSVFALIEADLRELRYIISSLSNHIAQITVSPDIVLCTTPIIESLTPSDLTSALTLSILLGEQSVSQVSSILEGLASNIFASNHAICSDISTNIELKKIGALRGLPYIETVPHVVVDTARPASGRFAEFSKSNILSKHKVAVSKGIRFTSKVDVYVEDSVKLMRSASSKSTCLSEGTSDASANALRIAGLDQTEQKIRSTTSSTMGASISFDISDDVMAESAHESVAVTSESQAIVHKSISETIVDSELLHRPSHLVSACDMSESATDDTFIVRPAKYAESKNILECYSKAEISTLELQYVTAANFAGTHVSCEFGTAWYPPVWVDGGLWIRQSHSVTQNDNGELVIT